MRGSDRAAERESGPPTVVLFNGPDLGAPGHRRAPVAGTRSSMERFQSDAFRGNRLLRDGTWVVAFLADWCPFCQRFRPQFSTLDGAGAFRVAIGDVTSEGSPLWEDFRIDVVPMVVVFHDGHEVFRAESALGQGLPKGSVEAIRSAAERPRTASDRDGTPASKA